MSNWDTLQVSRKRDYENYNDYNSILSPPVSTNCSLGGNHHSPSRYHFEHIDFPVSSPFYTECLYNYYNCPLSPPVCTDYNTEGSQLSHSTYVLGDVEFAMSSPMSTRNASTTIITANRSPVYTDNNSESSENSDSFDKFPSESPIYSDDSSEADEEAHFSNFSTISQLRCQFHKQNNYTLFDE